jgi:hypothetical protein
VLCAGNTRYKILLFDRVSGDETFGPILTKYSIIDAVDDPRT